MYIFSSCATSGLYGKSMLSFVRSCCLPKWLCHFEFPPAMNENSCHYTSMLAFAAVNVLDFLHPIRCAMASHCCFNFQFFSDYDIVLSQKLLPNPTSSGFSLLLSFRSFRILHFLFNCHYLGCEDLFCLVLTKRTHLYYCQVFLISSASVRFVPFLSFIVPIFAWNVPLVSLIFLKRSLVFPILLFSSISWH